MVLFSHLALCARKLTIQENCHEPIRNNWILEEPPKSPHASLVYHHTVVHTKPLSWNSRVASRTLGGCDLLLRLASSTRLSISFPMGIVMTFPRLLACVALNLGVSSSYPGAGS
jgi:hypothetical protein